MTTRPAHLAKGARKAAGFSLVELMVALALGLLVFFDRVWWLSVVVNSVLRTVGLDAFAT